MSWILATAVLAAAAVAGLFALRVGLALRNRRVYDVRELPGFLSDAECDHLIAKAAPLLRPSPVIQGGRRGGRDHARTSGTAYLDQAGDRVIQGIKRRVAEISDTRLDQQERIQVTHYEAGQRYVPHFDSLRSSRLDVGAAGDRVCTVIMYLNDDYEGGATTFPRVARRIRPRKGKAVLFYNLSADGERWDPLSLHAGEPVRAGEKWLANQWIRQHLRYSPQARAGGGRRRSRAARR